MQTADLCFLQEASAEKKLLITAQTSLYSEWNQHIENAA